MAMPRALPAWGRICAGWAERGKGSGLSADGTATANPTCRLLPDPAPPPRMQNTGLGRRCSGTWASPAYTACPSATARVGRRAGAVQAACHRPSSLTLAPCLSYRLHVRLLPC